MQVLCAAQMLQKYCGNLKESEPANQFSEQAILFRAKASIRFQDIWDALRYLAAVVDCQ